MDKQAFISRYGPLANDVAARTGLDPSVVLGTMAQESGWGEHLANNNPFGISPGNKPATYPTIQDGAMAYVTLMNSPRYKNAASVSDQRAQAETIARDGYNPDPQYGGKVAQIAESTGEAGYNAAPQPNEVPSWDQMGKIIQQDLGGTQPQQATPAPASAPAQQPDGVPPWEEMKKRIQQDYPIPPSATPKDTVQTPSLAAGYISSDGSYVPPAAIPAQGTTQGTAPTMVETTVGDKPGHLPTVEDIRNKLAPDKGWVSAGFPVPLESKEVSPGQGDINAGVRFDWKGPVRTVVNPLLDLLEGTGQTDAPSPLAGTVTPEATMFLLGGKLGGGKVAGGAGNKLIADSPLTAASGEVAAPASTVAEAAGPKPEITISQHGINVRTPDTHIFAEHRPGMGYVITRLDHTGKPEDFEQSGLAAMQPLIQAAAENNEPLHTMDVVTRPEGDLMDALEARGYPVTRHPDSQPVEEEGEHYIVNNSMQPTHTIDAPNLPQELLAVNPKSVGAAATPPKQSDYENPRIGAAVRQEYELARQREDYNKRSPDGIDRNEWVTGERPTAGQMDLSKATEEDSLRDNFPEMFKQRDAEDNAARVLAYEDKMRDPSSIVELETARDSQAKEDLRRAWSDAKPADASEVEDQINDMMAEGADLRPTVRQALTEVRNSLHIGRDPDAPLENSPKRLYAARQAITDMLSRSGQASNPAVALARSELVQLKNTLDGVITRAAPDYSAYLKHFEENSKPIDEAELLQSFRPRIVNAQGVIQLSRITNMINTVMKNRWSGGINPARSLGDDTMDTLFAIRNSLQRQEAARDQVRAIGSNSYGKTVRGAAMGHLKPMIGKVIEGAAHTAGAHVPVIGNMAVSAGKEAFARRAAVLSKEKMLTQAKEMLNPKGLKKPY